MADRSRWMDALGIRARFLLGFGAVVCVLLVSVLITVVGTGKMNAAGRELLAARLPETVDVLAVARAADSLLAATSPLVSVARQSELDAAQARVDRARAALAEALGAMHGGASGDRPVVALSGALEQTLDDLRDLSARRVALLERIDTLRRRVEDNRQGMQTALTYRARILSGDGDVMRRLLARPAPPLAKLRELADSLIPSLPVAQFYAEISAVHARLNAAPGVASISALSISRAALDESLGLAARLMEEMPEEVAVIVAPLLEELRGLALSEEGLMGLRARELAMMDDIRAAVAQMQQISGRVETEAAGLVDRSLADVRRSAAEADRVRQLYTLGLIGFACSGLLLVGLFFVFHIDRHLIRRLSELSRAMRDISRGQYDVALPPGGHDELGRLGSAVAHFHATARIAEAREADLRASRDALAHAKRELEEKTEALQHANERLAALSSVDSLTGLANRRRFDEALLAEWSRAARDRLPLSLVMIDIDHFKQLNDLYGHQVGDQCLRAVGGVLRDSARRAADLAARYGGEEFCLLLPGTDADTASRVALAAQKRVRALSLEHRCAPSGILTASFGVACLVPAVGQEPGVLVAAADEALYRAKHAGRDQVALAD